MELNKQDLQNILACLQSAKVEGINAAAALLQLYNKVARILQVKDENGNGNGAESAQPGADQPAAAVDNSDSGN